MQEYRTISKQNPSFPEHLDFQFLRDIGIKRLQQLSGKIWTDYNLHDPGVTILEVLCYAITDLGYRANLDIQDLLAPEPPDSQNSQHRGDRTFDDNFFTPDQILTCNPVTELDIRKRLVDIQGVNNAWVSKVNQYEPAIYIDHTDIDATTNTPTLKIGPDSKPELRRLHPKGLYRVDLDLELDVYEENEQNPDNLSQNSVMQAVKSVLDNCRNLCEDIHHIAVLGKEDISLKIDIEIDINANAEDTLVELYTHIQDFFAPQVQFYTLQELLDKGKSLEEIFSGRASAFFQETGDYKSHGFIDTQEFESLHRLDIIYAPDLYERILEVSSIVAIESLGIESYLNGVSQSKSKAYPWYLHITEGYRPVLSLEQSRINLFQQGVRLDNINNNKVKRRYYQQRLTHIKAFRDPYELDRAIPTGVYYKDLAKHHSIHHDFPLTYGIGEEKLPPTEPVKRKAQAKQLKAYLIFFDQILANYLSQLAHVRSLLSWESSKWHYNADQKQQHTYITPQPQAKDALRSGQTAQEILDFPGFKDIVQDYFEQTTGANNYVEFVQAIVEDTTMADQRRHQFLDHLLARFAVQFTDYALVSYQSQRSTIASKHPETNDELNQDLIHDKAEFLKHYPDLSRDRFRAFNYSQPRNEDKEGSNLSPNISGFQRRLEYILGMSDCHNPPDDERLYILEHILLRPQLSSNGDDIPEMLPVITGLGQEQSAEDVNMSIVDPYSFWISVMLPAWPDRFQDETVRQRVDQMIRLEAPAHIVLKVGWLAKDQMKAFKAAYDPWLEQLRWSKESNQQSCGLIPAQNKLIKVLSNLDSTGSLSQDSVLANAQGNAQCGKTPIILR